MTAPDETRCMPGSTVPELRDRIAQLTAGADPTPYDPGVWPTPAQYVHRWNLMTGPERLAEADRTISLLKELGPPNWLDIRGRVVDPESAPLGTTLLFPEQQDEHHWPEIAIRWSPPGASDEPYPWLIVGSEGPQKLSHDVVVGCTVLTGRLTTLCQAVEAETQARASRHGDRGTVA
ncbi:hypothetical protein GCM10022243_48350 [Saccharothrix violaceirubra]|uniref:Uncharacterized protein n=1 Tax=Saccharothrix violaceirubra TaxID=413306 RepID=A0A7W7SZH3_9PSEU|nr:hypothetical protein [Saccharothrix violaceirubra]MBB4963823.1 hypothetical protein [Saccharothrix violaceirubra]